MIDPFNDVEVMTDMSNPFGSSAVSNHQVEYSNHNANNEISGYISGMTY